MNKTCIILAGKVYDSISPYILDIISNYDDIIISTWDTQDKNIIQELNNVLKYKCIVQEEPDIKLSVNYQAKSISAGIKLATELGYTHVLRMRTELYSKNIKTLINLLDNNMDSNKLCFLMWYKNSLNEDGYLYDALIYGPVYKQLQFWNVTEKYNDTCTDEFLLQANYFSKTKLTYNDIKDQIGIFIHLMVENNIELHWVKPEYVYQGNLIKRYMDNNTFKEY